MGHTITEKILARAAGKPAVKAGDDIRAKPDFVLAYDFPSSSDVLLRHVTDEFGVKRVPEPERFGIFIDHMVPAITPQEEIFHQGTRAWCAANEVELFERRGIGHQVASEVGFATPGAFIMHHDPHIAQLGTFGALALGVRRNLLEAFISETVSLQVPSTVRVELTGRPLPGIMGRDIFHHIVRVIGPMGGRSGVLELAGPALADISIEGLQTITGLAMFVGAVSAIINPDERLLARALPLARKKLEPVFSDRDASYDAIHQIDISTLQPIVVVPPNPANTRDLADCAGTEVQVGYIGSCASGRLEDIRIAAAILKGRKVRKGFMLNIVPTSQMIMAAAAREGLIEPIVEAGAFVSSPSCDYCYGRIATMAPGQRAVSTGTLNVPGRMGSADSEIYIASAASVAAAAIEGRIVDPRQYL